MPQSYHIEYPLLAYKNFTPDNKEVCIINLCTYTNKIIDLGEFEFQSFVTHTQKIDQKVFHRKEESSTSIMLLAERMGVTHLMCIRSKPYEPEHEEHVFVFNGVLPDPQRLCIEMDKKAKEHQARRFTADKMQSVQLITNKSYIEHSRHQ